MIINGFRDNAMTLSKPRGRPFQKGHHGGTPFQKGHVPWHNGTKGVMKAWNRGMKIQTNTGRTHFKKGHNTWQKGRKLNENQLQALLNANKNKKQCLITRLKRGFALRGKRAGAKCNLWKGGKNPFRIILRDLSDSFRWRKHIFERDDYTCCHCRTKGGYLEAHHLKPFSVLIDEFLERYSHLSILNDKALLVDLAQRHEPFWNIDNGITLCKSCHTKTKGGN